MSEEHSFGVFNRLLKDSAKTCIESLDLRQVVRQRIERELRELVIIEEYEQELGPEWDALARYLEWGASVYESDNDRSERLKDVDDEVSASYRKNAWDHSSYLSLEPSSYQVKPMKWSDLPKND